MKLFTLLQTKYIQFENAIKGYLSKTLSDYNVSYGDNTIFGQLINVLNGVVQNVMLYIEDSLVEQNKYTAQRKKSIYGLAALSGYTPHLGKASGVQLKITYTPSNVKNTYIVINNKESVTCDQNGMQYHLMLPQEAVVLDLDKSNKSLYVYAVQGRFETQRFVSIGGLYYTQNFNFIGNLDVDYLTVKINDKKWDFVPSLYDMNSNGEQWTYKISPVGGIDIIFGNDVHGKSLKNGDTIEITYLLHDGEYGNINVNNNTYFLFDNLLQDINGGEIDGNAVFNVTFASLDPITSGSNSESIEQVRHMIGYNSRSLVLAGPENYSNFLSKFSFCGYNRTWSEPGSMIVNSLVMKNYKQLIKDGKTYFDLKESDFKLSETQKQSIINCLEKTGNQLAGVTYQISDPEICKYAMYVYVKLKDKNYDKDYITSKIRSLIGDFFTDIQSDIFIPKSDIIQLLKNNILEIDGINIYILSERNETAQQVGYYDKYIAIKNSLTSELKQSTQKIYLYPGENPNIGFDNHGNIYLEQNNHFPVLMGGWDYVNSNGDEITITDPLIIVYE